MSKKINARHNTPKTNKGTTDPKISEHFRNLGKASWEARKKALLDKNAIPKPNV